jgi:hypothetical protein
MKKLDSESTTKTAPTLNDLIMSGEEMDDGELAAALHGKVGIAKENLNVRLFGPLVRDASKKRLVAAGLARHAMVRQGWIGDEDLSASADWFAKQIQQKPKSVTEELSRLKKAGLLERDERGWRVPSWALSQAIEFIRH